MFLKYKQLQIVKHALQYYMKRVGASAEDLKSEAACLKKVTEEVERIKELHKIR